MRTYRWFRRKYFNDSRSDEELDAAARALFKGCKRHFMNSSDRLCKMSEVKEKEDLFRRLVSDLLVAETMQAFYTVADRIVEEFPMVRNWLDWWKRPDVAAMIFRSHREMQESSWDALPDTTNAEESMHWCLYSAVGNNLETMTGLASLVTFAASFQQMYDDARSKWRIHYTFRL